MRNLRAVSTAGGYGGFGLMSDTYDTDTERCRWLGCTREPVVRVPKTSPKIGDYDLPLCQRHAQRATGARFPTTKTIGDS